MKKMFFALFTMGVIFSASSCKKCGYCDYGGGNHSSATCSSATLSVVGVNEYKQAEADCQAAAGVWVKE